MIQSVVRAFQILETIKNKSSRDGIGLVDIATELKLEKSTVYNLIKTLLAQGYVAQDGSGGKYRLGEKLWDLVHGELGDEFLEELVTPFCRDLQQQTGENISFVAYRAGVLKIICRILCDNELIVAPNNFKPLYTTFSGRCLLAQLDKNQLEHIVNVLGFPGETWNGINDFKSLHYELETIKKTGKLIFESSERQLGGAAFIIEAPARFAPLAVGTALPLFRFRRKKKLIISAFSEFSSQITALIHSE